MRLNDPELVRREYADESRLAGRISAYRFTEGPDARDVAVGAVTEVHSGRVLEVGCGRGELAERLVPELGVELVAIDQSQRMVELTRERGVDARVGDVQRLPFADGTFDCVLAAWMLYHVPDLDRGLREVARVLRPGGRLVAVTNMPEHLHELAGLLGGERAAAAPFNGDNGALLLGRYFERVERRDALGSILFPSRAEAQAYVDSTIALSQVGSGQLPSLDGPVRVTCAPVVFVADRA